MQQNGFSDNHHVGTAVRSSPCTGRAALGRAWTHPATGDAISCPDRRRRRQQPHRLRVHAVLPRYRHPADILRQRRQWIVAKTTLLLRPRSTPARSRWPITPGPIRPRRDQHERGSRPIQRNRRSCRGTYGTDGTRSSVPHYGRATDPAPIGCIGSRLLRPCLEWHRRGLASRRVRAELSPAPRNRCARTVTRHVPIAHVSTLRPLPAFTAAPQP